jgi:uncharacterized membrane protein
MVNRYPLVSGVVFALVAVLQAARVLAGWTVQIGPFTVPLMFSCVAAIVAAGLSVWAFKSRIT